ncbi:MAG TPA: translation initiation factor eIF-2B [Candidatus Competibacter sp.]|nr:initiation factor 2B [Candidatus Competibacteraceae bacterium]HRC74004.1 translation initiation factor eIF-2B [Candidatus Competibacter sp.]
MSPAEFNQKITEIREDRVRGASELARGCLAVLAQAARELPAESVAEWQKRLLQLSADLAETRPSMTPVGNLLRRWNEGLAVDARSNLPVARRSAAGRAEGLIERSRRAVADCAAHAARLLGSGRPIMTHSFSSTVLETCRLLKDRELRMIVTESRPLEEGRRLAEQLSAWRVPTVYVTDAQMGLFVAEAAAVLVGADSVLADGAVLNKAGTYLLALAARERGVPFYVCCESFKRRAASDPPWVLEEMAATELGVPLWPEVTVRNVYFEVTPARLVSAWIDETGVRQSRENQ